MKDVTCYKCKCQFGLPDDLYAAARCSEKINWSCPYGHWNVFCEGESNETKLRRERDRLTQQIAQRDDEIKALNRLYTHAEETAKKHRTEALRLRKRASGGACPCCNRTFINMARHMKAKHPEFLEPPHKLTVVK